ncbi:MAG: hypothetical protein JXB07_01265 [Anaerolineae bacterium]|nr:hypothetical protein [Anaerolineae bacterium]
MRAYSALLRGERWENPRAWLYRVASRLATDDQYLVIQLDLLSARLMLSMRPMCSLTPV